MTNKEYLLKCFPNADTEAFVPCFLDKDLVFTSCGEERCDICRNIWLEEKRKDETD